MIDEESLRGATSNPAIFEKAILGSDDYDDQLEQLANEGADGRETYRAMVVRDVQAGVRRLPPDVGADRPRRRLRLARGRARPRERHRGHDHRRPVLLGARRPPERDDQDPRHARGRRRRSRPPRTRASTSTSRCCSASTRTARSPRRTSAGMERRKAEGKSLDVHSVASFFVSRVDTEVDKRLDKLGGTTTSRASPAWPTRATPTSSSSTSSSRGWTRSAARRSARCGRRPA